MSNKKKAERREAIAVADGRRRRSRPSTKVVTIAAVGAVIGIGWWVFGDHAAESTVSPALVEDKAGAEVAPIDYFGKLPGRWERTDGGYIIDIKSVEPNGAMIAAYLNPRPIRIVRAEAVRHGAAAKIMIELRDVNYPGSTYELVYDPQRDQLVGVYFQAVDQQHFEVSFTRLK
jgi:hypothetical protein